MKKYAELKKQREDKLTNLFSECLVFWAFSNEQFNESKTKLEEGEKYVSIGAGGYMPKGKVDAFNDGFKAIEKWYKNEIKLSKLNQVDILYELNNHESFYTCDISEAFEVLKDRYTLKEVKMVYEKHKNDKELNY